MNADYPLPVEHSSNTPGGRCSIARQDSDKIVTTLSANYGVVNDLAKPVASNVLIFDLRDGLIHQTFASVTH